ncbi:hypothetical protein GCM10010885_19560 [Alicyclobacillus cellulosilyticus]|uniref:Uncharacterized protein n=1 Tax=Alicyclobacillus cellulosilyticus TaxID=1003997 RepID=A0A917NN66_9BACL|nr:hypothetical protein [Alicyclobacillus cellulosilyticus]GGJ10435.1 hypothetical protein GCM10010885_19560 [Alicyclobacillus cellulosilyticus]
MKKDGLNVKRKLFEKYYDFSIRSGNELYLPLSMAMNFVNDCTRLGLVVVELEFFHIEGDKITPVVEPLTGLDCSNVFEEQWDWSHVVQQCNSVAMLVLENEAKRDDTQYVNFTILSRDEAQKWKTTGV